MPTKKISELPAGSASANAVVPATNADGTLTEKVTLGSIAALAPVVAGSGISSVVALPTANTNVASGDYSAIGGGSGNTASAEYSTVSGGSNNAASIYGSTVGGGLSNTASDQWATVSGGLFNAASIYGSTVGGGESNTASAGYSTVSGGLSNTASAGYSTVSGGLSNTASGSYSAVGGGSGNTASGGNSTVSGGSGNVASGDASCAGGVEAVADRRGMCAYASGTFATAGDAQRVDFVLRASTSNATPQTMTSDGSSVRLTIPSGKALFATVAVAGIINGGSKAVHYCRKVAIKNVAGTTALIGAVSTVGTDVEDDAAYDVAITADNTNDALQIDVTGKASETIRWVAHVEGVEISYG
jgi:hypothetical protein